MTCSKRLVLVLLGLVIKDTHLWTASNASFLCFALISSWAFALSSLSCFAMSNLESQSFWTSTNFCANSSIIFWRALSFCAWASNFCALRLSSASSLFLATSAHVSNFWPQNSCSSSKKKTCGMRHDHTYLILTVKIFQWTISILSKTILFYHGNPVVKPSEDWKALYWALNVRLPMYHFFGLIWTNCAVLITKDVRLNLKKSNMDFDSLISWHANFLDDNFPRYYN